MKRKLFLFMASLFLSGPLFAQTNHWTPATGYSLTKNIVGRVFIDGELQASSNIEIAAFINGEPRAAKRLNAPIQSYPELFFAMPVVMFNANETGQPVTFKIYDHTPGVEKEYDSYTTTFQESSISITATQQTLGTYSDPVDFFFVTTQTFTKTITPYTVVGTNGEDKANHWYLIASPIGTVSPEDVTNMLSNSYDLYYYDQTQEKEWKNYKANQFDLVPGKGYLYANSGDNGNAVTLTFVGTPFNNPGEVTLVYDAGVNQNTDLIGWNLVGNPFPETAYIDRSFYRMNEYGTDLESYSGAIASMEGVFVKATSASDNSLTFSTSSSKGSEQLIVSLSQNRGASIDRAIVCFNEGDVLPKFMLNESNTKLYIPQGDHDYAVVRSAAQGEFPLNFRASENGTYTLNIDTENVEMNYLHLIDNLTGMDVDLLQTSSYSFEAKVNDYESRFRLVFAANNEDSVSTGSTAFAFFSNGNWIINNDGKATLQIVDINGRILCNEQINGCYSKSFEAAPGVYMLRLINGDNVKVQKLVVR
jgi:hypothetical protein